jgi:hypothetical protein
MLSMGTYPDTSLADARKRRDEARQKIESGTDPGAQRRLTEGAPERTFEAVAQHYLAGLERKVLLKKRSPATLRKARWALRDYVFPCLGSKPIDSRIRQAPNPWRSALVQSLNRQNLGVMMGHRHLVRTVGARVPPSSPNHPRRARLISISPIPVNFRIVPPQRDLTALLNAMSAPSHDRYGGCHLAAEHSSCSSPRARPRDPCR